MKTKTPGTQSQLPVTNLQSSSSLSVLKTKLLSYLNIKNTLAAFFFTILQCFQVENVNAQTYFFEPCSPPFIGSLVDAAYIDTLETIPQLDSIEFVQFHSNFIADTFGVIKITLPRARNADLEFNIFDVYYENANDFFIQAKSAEGYLTIYVKGSMKGATIDLIDTVYTIYPFTGNIGILIQNDLSLGETSICAQEQSSEAPEFCEEEDCGEDILDILLLISPEAKTWLNNRYNSYATWFLLVETHNILGAFRRSDIPNKRIRYAYVNYTQDFSASTNNTNSRARAQEDLNSFENSDLAQDLLIEYNADIAVLLSNYNWNIDLQPVFGIANLGPYGDPYAIAQVANIDAARYTLAHEIGHVFGCQHENVEISDCPRGMHLSNGRNTIMARSNDFDRIQNFSNPDITFGGSATGIEGERDNAQQIRSAFCEVANNDQHAKYGVRIFNSLPVCTDEPNYFTASVATGQCYDPLFNNYSNCGVSPFSYYWEISRHANFSTAYSPGTSSSCYFLPPNSGVYFIRVTVTSNDALVTSFSKMLQAETCPSAELLATEEAEALENIKLLGSPASDYVILKNLGRLDILSYTIFDLTGQAILTNHEMEIIDTKINDQNPVYVPLVHLVPGMYILSIRTTLGTKSFQVVKI
jgi:hypothetical protein